MKRTVFILSDRTGITAETLGHGLLTQFENIELEQKMVPFIDTPEKAVKVVEKINRAAVTDGAPPLLFSTLIDPEIRSIIEDSDGILHDFFDTFINPLEIELGTKSAHAVGRSHGMGVYASYKARIDAVNFAQGNDDGVTTKNYPDADVILVGVSRSGKTPTCLYLALQFGIHAANYPLTEEDLDSSKLPAILEPYRHKLYGLTIDPLRLQQIRKERRPDSRYSSRQQCSYEVKTVENMYRREQIPFLDTSLVSIEEIATTILHKTKLKRHFHG